MESVWLILLVISAIVGYYIYRARLSERLLDSPGPGGSYTPPSVPPGHIHAGPQGLVSGPGAMAIPVAASAQGGDALAGVMLNNLLHNGLINQSQFDQWRELPVDELKDQLVGSNIMNPEQVSQFTNRQQEILRNNTFPGGGQA